MIGFGRRNIKKKTNAWMWDNLNACICIYMRQNISSLTKLVQRREILNSTTQQTPRSLFIIPFPHACMACYVANVILNWHVI